MQFIDTADSYGPGVAEDIIREALHPYPDDIVIATKAGLTRNGPDVIDTNAGPKRLGPAAWPPVGRPEYLRQQALMSLRRLGLEQIELFQLHRIDPQVPLADQVGELKKLQDEGKIVAIGLSQVSTDQLTEASQIADIATVQSRYNLNDRTAQDILGVCEARGDGADPVGAAGPRRPQQRRRPAAPHRPQPQRQHRTGCSSLVTGRFTQHSAHPWHVPTRAPGRQPCRRRPRTVTRRDDRTERCRRMTSPGQINPERYRQARTA